MGRKPKAGGAEGRKTDPAQSARFIEAAREAGVDETGEAFERAFDRVAPSGRPDAGETKPRPAKRGRGTRA